MLIFKVLVELEITLKQQYHSVSAAAEHNLNSMSPCRRIVFGATFLISKLYQQLLIP
jgi:hypothetical protein